MAYTTPASSILQTPCKIEEIEMKNQRSARATSNGASSSSTAADSNNSSSNIPLFDVFINHRGEVKKNFASHLYRALLLRGLRPFLDQQDLQEGLPFPSQLEAVISNASVHVAIFSPKYAESRWCLDELVLMLQSGAPIIPVFYHVNPTDLRWTAHNKTGVYAISLQELELKKTFDAGTQQEKLRYDPATIQKWKDALSSVADINGFDLNGKFNGDEVHMIDKIVERVGEMIRKPGLYVAKHPTGLDDKVTDFEATVFKQQHAGEIQVAGIVGLGGMGKTTLALELFNRMSSKYNKSFFLSDVREKANKNSLYSVQRELLRGLTEGLPDRELDINNIYEGIGKFERHLKSAHVLLILDDIDHEDQLEALLSVKNVFRSDSFILITSRYKDVLERSGVEHFYQLRGLSKEHSQQLFCSYSFCQTYPFHEFEDLVDRFLKVCDGLPLALKVLGALLFKKHKSYWEAKLDELTVQMNIKNRLKISYEALSEDEQKIFLDIACFFIGEKRTSAIAVWDASGWNGLMGLTNLEGKCLIEVDDKNVIHMHDQLRDLGRHIAEEETPRRLWRPTRNIVDLLTINVLTEARGIMMLPRGHSIERVESSQMLSCYQWWSQQLLGNFLMQLICNSLYNLHYCFLGFDVLNLQLVETEGHMLDRILRVPSPNLIWLSWRHCPYTSLPPWITIKNLRVLRVEGGVLETLWQSKSQAPLQLQELEIINASCFWSIPKSIGQLKHLERIVVLNAGSLKSLPDSLSKLTNLHSLDLKSCKKLERLPDSFGSLTNLHSLNLRWCEKLERLPDSFGSLTNLHSLDLVWCQKLERLPDSFGSLTNLHSLDLEWCKLERLPDSFGSLTNLHSLDLSVCKKLGRLPDSFGSLTNLHSLDLEWCKLERLPDSFGSLTNLHSLDLSVCKKLERLPDSFGSLTNLHSLDLRWCEKLEGLPDSFGSLTNLHRLDLRWCEKLERLPVSFGSLTNLHSLDLGLCEKLERLPDSFGSLTNLYSLDLRACEKLERLPDSFGSLTNLHSLYLGECEKLERLPDSFGSLNNLHRLDLRACVKLERLPDSFGSLTNLPSLDLGRCEKLERLPNSFGSLTNLHSLDLGRCEKLERLPDSFGRLTNLHSLDLGLCEKLERLPDSFGRLTNLHNLDLKWCQKLERLPDSFGRLTNLHSLDLGWCEKLERLPESFGSLTNLQSLQLRWCKQLERLPDSLGSLTALKYFEACSCASLRISSETFGNIRTLEHIDLSGCGKVEVFPWQLAHQRSLKTLKLTDTNFKEMPSAIELPRDLEVLWIGNPLLERVMPSSLGNLLNLKELHLEYRGELKCLSASVERSSELSWLKVAGCPIIDTSEVFYDNVEYPKLKELILEECINLAEVGTLPKALTEVTLIGCDNLRRIEGLCGLAMLRKLHIEKCKELKELPSVKTMVSLEKLHIIDCVNLKSIRDLRWLTELERLMVHGCPELGELEGVADCTELEWFSVTGCPKLRLDERVVERLHQKCRWHFELEELNQEVSQIAVG